MKAKLIKDHADYHLVDDKRFIISTTDKVMLSCTDKQKLSLKNCQAIERGYDLDELADEYIVVKPKYREHEHNMSVDAFKAGFQKAIELMGDKKFSEEDVKNIFAKTLENAPSTESHTRMISDVEYRHSVMDELYDKITKSLQQNEWNVEIEMICPHPSDTYKCGIQYGCDEDGCNHPNKIPLLDADGCLILKPLPKE